MSDDKLIEAIEHYQRNLDRGLKDDNTAKLLHCIFKLSNLPITVGHLEETGVGRTVNAMRKMDGKVGDASRELVNKWKVMVSQNQDCDDINKNEPNGKSDSSHKQSDKSRNRSDNSDSESENSSSDDKSSDGKSSENSSENEEDDDEDDFDRYEDSKRHKSESPPREREKYKNREKYEENSRSRSHHKKSSRDRNKYVSKSSSDRYKEYDRKEKEFKIKRESSRSPEKNQNKERERSKSSSSSNKRKNDDESEKSYSKKHKSHHHKEDDYLNETKNESSKKNKDKSRSESKNKEISSSKKDSKRDNFEKKSKSKDVEKSPSKKSNRNENGICSESGTSFADALGMLEPSTSRSTVTIISSNSNKKIKPEKSLREKTPERYHKESLDKEDKKEKKREKEKEIGGENSGNNNKSSKREKSKERDKKGSTSSSSSSSSSSKIEVVIPPPPPKNDLDINISSLLPTITPNYRPLANPLYESMQNLGRGKTLNDDEALSLVMSQKNQRTKVYSGNKMFFNSIPTLFELCIRVLQDNIDALEYTGGVPYIILKPVLDKASTQQLYALEHYNPYLIEDTDELWQFHCSKEFKNKRREELESWREMYMRCLDEREAKLKTLTENIKVAQEKSTPVRQTKLAYIDSFVKPPRDVIRKQAKNGIDKKPFITPQSRLNAIAAGSSSAQVSVPNPVRASSSNNSSASIKPKKAPLMQKTLAFLKGGRFRR